MILQVPAFTAVTCPLELTVATSSSLDFHVILSLLSAGVRVALSCFFSSPIFIIIEVWSSFMPVAVADEESP